MVKDDKEKKLPVHISGVVYINVNTTRDRSQGADELLGRVELCLKRVMVVNGA